MKQVLRPRGGSVNHQSSHLIMYVCAGVCRTDASGEDVPTQRQLGTRRGGFVSLLWNMPSCKDICGAAFSAFMTKPHPCEKKNKGRDIVPPELSPGLELR